MTADRERAGTCGTCAGTGHQDPGVVIAPEDFEGLDPCRVCCGTGRAPDVEPGAGSVEGAATREDAGPVPSATEQSHASPPASGSAALVAREIARSFWFAILNDYGPNIPYLADVWAKKIAEALTAARRDALDEAAGIVRRMNAALCRDDGALIGTIHDTIRALRESVEPRSQR